MERLSLPEIQHRMFSVITNPLTRNQRMAGSLPTGENVDEISDSIIKASENLAGFERLEIYNRQYWFRLLDCLYDDFPGLRAIVGESRFYDLTTAYLNRYPSESRSLRDLGSRLEKFLREEPAWLGRNKLAALDMARLEWAQAVAFDGASLPTLTPERLHGSHFDSLTVTLQPYLTLLKLNYPFDDFIINLRRIERSRSEASHRARPRTSRSRTVIPKRQSIYLAVHRYDNSVFYKRLDRPAFTLLRLLQLKHPLSHACQLVLPLFGRREARAAVRIRRWFQTWTRLGWFAAPQVND